MSTHSICFYREIRKVAINTFWFLLQLHYKKTKLTNNRRYSSIFFKSLDHVQFLCHQFAWLQNRCVFQQQQQKKKKKKNSYFSLRQCGYSLEMPLHGEIKRKYKKNNIWIPIPSGAAMALSNLNYCLLMLLFLTWVFSVLVV